MRTVIAAMLVDILASILLGGPFLALVAISWFWPAPPLETSEDHDWVDVAADVIFDVLFD